MSRFLIDERGNVKAKSTSQKNVYFKYPPEDVDEMIADGKFTQDEVEKIRTNRLTHAQKVIQNDRFVMNPGHSEEPLPIPSLNYGDEQKQNEEQQGDGESALPLPTLNFDND